MFEFSVDRQEDRQAKPRSKPVLFSMSREGVPSIPGLREAF
jgi:hypothetical protein